jgi:hypothetical protein
MVSIYFETSRSTVSCVILENLNKSLHPPIWEIKVVPGAEKITHPPTAQHLKENLITFHPVPTANAMAVDFA